LPGDATRTVGSRPIAMMADRSRAVWQGRFGCIQGAIGWAEEAARIRLCHRSRGKGAAGPGATFDNELAEMGGQLIEHHPRNVIDRAARIGFTG